MTARRLVIVYVVIAAVAGGITAASLLIGRDHRAEPEIAGGYDLARGDRCLGARFELRQSGRYVDLSSATGTQLAKLELVDGRVDGLVRCPSGARERFDAVAGAGTLTGTIAGRGVRAALRRPAPAPGALPRRAPGSIDGDYRLAPASECLGPELGVRESGAAIALVVDESTVGRGSYRGGRVAAAVRCRTGGRATLTGEALDRTITVVIESAAARERIAATKLRGADALAGAVILAIAIVMLVARLFGAAAARLGQPRVMGEVVAGIALGPTLLGAILPDVQRALFPSDVIPFIGVVAQLGLVFYMFLVGLELDPRLLAGRRRQVAVISNASFALPLSLGIVVALPLYGILAPPTSFAAFGLFIGVAMAVTAFPVLARMLVEQRMLARPVGALTLACAAVDDVTAWLVIAVAIAVATAGTATGVVVTIAAVAAFCLVMALGVRPLLARAAIAYDEADRMPGGWSAVIFAAILLAAFATEEIGVALIFGPFILGLAMPRHARLSEHVCNQLEYFVLALLLPLFFAFTGLRTYVGLINRPVLVLIAGVLLTTAVVGKLFGAALAARATGLEWRSATAVGVLMNTRGLTELIVLNLALEVGVISESLFAMLVMMALVTTFMAWPLLRVVDPRNELGAPVEEEMATARAVAAAEAPALPAPEHAILVAGQTAGVMARLRSLAEPLAASVPPRELILVRLVAAPRTTAVRGGLQTENRLLAEASAEVTTARRELARSGIAARASAFISADPATDLSRLAAAEEVEVVIVDGRRAFVGDAVPRGTAAGVLRDAPCDVAVLVTRGGARVRTGPGSPVVVPFGGADHDWAALELGGWLAAATGAPLQVLGAAAGSDDGARVTRRLADAALLLQEYAALEAQPLVVEPGPDAVVGAAAGAGLLVIGLSERWREEGLGSTRAAIARAAPAPVLFVRRGVRQGALAPRSDVTRFAWSMAGAPGAPALREGPQ